MSDHSPVTKKDQDHLVKQALGWRGIMLSHILLFGFMLITGYYAWHLPQ